MKTDWALSIIVFFILGMAIGYGLCRRMIHAISLQEAGKRITARIFGYPEPVEPRPTIAELDAILSGEDIAIKILPNGEVITQ